MEIVLREREKNKDIPSPTELGWKHETVDANEELMIDWMEGPPVPAAMLELLACICTHVCQLASCHA